jgi:hypothetical protein
MYLYLDKNFYAAPISCQCINTCSERPKQIDKIP